MEAAVGAFRENLVWMHENMKFCDALEKLKLVQYACKSVSGSDVKAIQKSTA